MYDCKKAQHDKLNKFLDELLFNIGPVTVSIDLLFLDFN